MTQQLQIELGVRYPDIFFNRANNGPYTLVEQIRGLFFLTGDILTSPVWVKYYLSSTRYFQRSFVAFHGWIDRTLLGE